MSDSQRKPYFYDLVFRQWSPYMAYALSTVAGGVERTVVYPLDLVKTRLQLQTQTKKKQRKYKTIRQTLASSLREEGFRRTYRGLTLSLAAFPGLNICRIVLAEQLRSKLYSSAGTESFGRYILLAGAGAAVGAVESVFVTPWDVGKIRLQAYQAPVTVVGGDRNQLHLTIRSVYRSIWSNAGKQPWNKLVGLYHGQMATLLRQSVYGSSVFVGYEFLKSHFLYHNEEPFGFKLLVCGTGAGLFAALVGAPFDTVRTRVLHSTKPLSIGRTLVSIYREEGGLRGLYRGCKTKCYKTVVGTFVFLVVYENLVRFTILPDSSFS